MAVSSAGSLGALRLRWTVPAWSTMATWERLRWTSMPTYTPIAGLLPCARRSPKPRAVGLSRRRGPDLHSVTPQPGRMARPGAAARLRLAGDGEVGGGAARPVGAGTVALAEAVALQWLLGTGEEALDVLAEGGAVLEAVPGAAADHPGVGGSGQGRDDELVVGGQLVLADPAASLLEPREGGEAPREVSARAGLVVVVQLAAAVLGIEVAVGLGVVGGDLEAAPVQVEDAIERPLEVVPDWQRRHGPAGRRLVVVILAARDPQSDQPGEQPRQPRPAGPHHPVGVQGLPIHRDRGAPQVAARPSLPTNRPRALGDREPGEHLDRRASVQRAGGRLQQPVGQVAGIQARVQGGDLGGREALDRDALRAQRGLAVVGEAAAIFVLLDEPHHARLDQQRRAGLLLELVGDDDAEDPRADDDRVLAHRPARARFPGSPQRLLTHHPPWPNGHKRSGPWTHPPARPSPSTQGGSHTRRTPAGGYPGTVNTTV